jgi:DNA-binding NarL/FixJ family response regulator
VAHDTFVDAVGTASILLIDEACCIDCVVLELDLQDMSGFEVLLRLVPIARQPEIPVIILTHLTSSALLEVALKNGAVAGLRKTNASGDMLDKAIVQAISIVARSKDSHRYNAQGMASPEEELHLRSFWQ